jgi:hypothetical protein
VTSGYRRPSGLCAALTHPKSPWPGAVLSIPEAIIGWFFCNRRSKFRGWYAVPVVGTRRRLAQKVDNQESNLVKTPLALFSAPNGTKISKITR